jgi:hypothetical protein
MKMVSGVLEASAFLQSAKSELKNLTTRGSLSVTTMTRLYGALGKMTYIKSVSTNQVQNIIGKFGSRIHITNPIYFRLIFIPGTGIKFTDFMVGGVIRAMQFLFTLIKTVVSKPSIRIGRETCNVTHATQQCASQSQASLPLCSPYPLSRCISACVDEARLVLNQESGFRHLMLCRRLAQR